MRRGIVRLVAVLAVKVVVPAGIQPVAAGDAGVVATVPISFQTDNGWWYDGRIELPAQERRRDWAVMLVVGGRATDIDWTVPGILTLDGKPTRDADTLSRALLDRGFVVMRWQAIHRDDPKHAR